MRIIARERVCVAGLVLDGRALPLDPAATGALIHLPPRHGPTSAPRVLELLLRDDMRRAVGPAGLVA